MFIRTIRTRAKTASRPWVLVTAGTAITVAAVISPVARHAASPPGS